MASLYLMEQGAVLKKKYRRLIVTKDKHVLKEVPIFKINRIIIFGNIQITSQAIKFLLESNIETSFMSYHGRYRGKLMPIESKNIFLRLAQYERYLDNDFHVSHCRNIVEAKIINTKTLLKRYLRNHQEIDISDNIEKLERVLSKLQNKQSVATIRGLEGRASAIYFNAYGMMFRKELRFDKRNRRPPKDPINALLSFGYTLITNEIDSMLAANGFDTYIGYLHGIDYGRPSLALDIVEEFRQPVIDRFTLKLINNNIIGVEDFENKNPGVYLSERSRKLYFIHYEKMMDNIFVDYRTKINITFRTLFQRQAQRLKRTIRQGDEYEPFRMA